jgi:hypothetical protein
VAPQYRIGTRTCLGSNITGFLSKKDTHSSLSLYSMACTYYRRSAMLTDGYSGVFEQISARRSHTSLYGLQIIVIQAVDF